MLETELNSSNSLVPQQWRHKYFVDSPLQLVFAQLCFKRISMGVYRKVHRIVKYLKIKIDESEYRTQGTNVSLS